MDVMSKRTEPEQSFRNEDQVRFAGLDQAEAGREDVHFLVTSLNVGRPLASSLSDQAHPRHDLGVLRRADSFTVIETRHHGRDPIPAA